MQQNASNEQNMPCLLNATIWNNFLELVHSVAFSRVRVKTTAEKGLDKSVHSDIQMGIQRTREDYMYLMWAVNGDHIIKGVYGHFIIL